MNVPFLNIEQGVYREYGFIESITNVFLFIALIYGMYLSWTTRNRYQQIWFILISLGTFYFLGEEISWGQHYLKFQTPEVLQEVNKQAELNLHNLTGTYERLFSKIPRQMLSIASVVGGLLFPLIFMKKKIDFPRKSINHWIWPSYTCGITALFANIVALPDKFANNIFHFDLHPLLQINYNETKEAFLSLFILLYCVGFSSYISQFHEKPAAGEK